MRYLLLIYTAESEEPPPDDVAAASHAAYAEFTRDVKGRGLFQAGEALTPVEQGRDAQDDEDVPRGVAEVRTEVGNRPEEGAGDRDARRDGE